MSEVKKNTVLGTGEALVAMRIGSVDLDSAMCTLVAEGAFNSENHGDENVPAYGIRVGSGGVREFYLWLPRDKDAPSKQTYFDRAEAGMFIKELNMIRGLRPGGGKRRPGRQADIPAGVERCRFECCRVTKKSILVRMVAGRLRPSEIGGLKHTYRVLPNLAPFDVNGQFLIIPESESIPELPHVPQELTERLLSDFITICRNSEGLVIFFNSKHAGASVDHLHFQTVPHTSRLPIERALPERHGRLDASYPINGLAFPADGDGFHGRLWKLVAELHKTETPFNLIYVSNTFIVVPRDIENEITSEFNTLLASMEICGRFITSSREAYDNATEGRIVMALQKSGIAYEDIPSLDERGSK